MRWIELGNRLSLMAALAAALASGSGCRRAPYLDQANAPPADPAEMMRQEDEEVRQAAFFDDRGSAPLPPSVAPRTLENPEREETWEMTLEEAIRIGLDNSEVVRVIPFGAQGIPISGFEPQFLAVGNPNALGAGNLASVYDPAIRETRIASALSQFDANISTTLFWSRNVLPFNNAIQSGLFNTNLQNRSPVVSFQDQAQFSTTLQKRIADGSTAAITQNINYQYANNPTNAFPSAYTSNLQLRFSKPLLGSAPTSQFNPNPLPVGVEANRAPIVIARHQADFTVWQVKSQVMEMVRSIEQQYWAVAQAQTEYWAAETAVGFGEEIVRREEAKVQVGRSALPNLAEAQQNLERFKLDFIARTSNLITVERQLRNLLGLPPADNRRIVPATSPVEARLQPNYDASLRQMLDFLPDIVEQQINVRVAELQLLIARNQLLPVLNFDALYQFNGLGRHLDQSLAVMTGKSIQAINPITQSQQRAAGLNPTPGQFNNFQSWQVGLTFQMPLGYRGPLADVNQAQYTLLQQRAFLQQIVHQSTHQIHRFFLEIDANYKLLKTAGRFKAAALQRLESQKAYYEEGTVLIDRYLEAVNVYAQAVSLEAQYRTSYNNAIIALEQAKGTLLAYDNVAFAEGPWPAEAYDQAHDQQAAHRQFPVGDDGDYHPRPINDAGVPDPVVPVAPPNYEPGQAPPMPAPGGDLPPGPYPLAPTVPAGEPPVLSGRPVLGAGAAPVASIETFPPLPEPVEPDVLPASAEIGPEDMGRDIEESSYPMEVPLDLPSPPTSLPPIPEGGAEPAPLPPLLPGS